MWGAAGMVYEVEEPDAKDPNYDEVAQVSTRCPSPRLSVSLAVRRVRQEESRVEGKVLLF